MPGVDELKQKIADAKRRGEDTTALEQLLKERESQVGHSGSDLETEHDEAAAEQTKAGQPTRGDKT